MKRHYTQLWLIVAVVGALGGCQNDGRVAVLSVPDSLMVQRIMPDVHGRAACRLFDSTPGYGTCEFGQGLRVSFRRDTIRWVMASIELDKVDTTASLLDYWNRHLRDAWESRMGRVADSLVQPLMTDMLTAVWNMKDSVRQSVALFRFDGRVTLSHEIVDCRSGEAGGWCRLTPK